MRSVNRHALRQIRQKAGAADWPARKPTFALARTLDLYIKAKDLVYLGSRRVRVGSQRSARLFKCET
jgi:hypothetical protein